MTVVFVAITMSSEHLGSCKSVVIILRLLFQFFDTDLFIESVAKKPTQYVGRHFEISSWQYVVKRKRSLVVSQRPVVESW